jgi:hypothetical protein
MDLALWVALRYCVASPIPDPRRKIAAPVAPSSPKMDVDNLATVSEFTVRTNH